MKKKVWRWVGCVLLACLLVLIVLQLALRPSAAYETEIATAAAVDDRLEYRGVIAKTTSVVKATAGKVVCYTAEDGARVAKGQVLGYLYDTEEEVQTRLAVNRLDEQITLLKAASANTALVSTQYESLTNQMNKAVVSLMQGITKGDFSGIGSCETSYIPVSARREIAVDAKISFASTLKELQAKRDNLSAGIPKEAKTVTAPVAGFFSRGGIVCISPSEVSQMTVAGLDTLAKQEPVDVIGVLSSDYTWSFVGTTDAQRVADLKAGNTVHLDFGQTENIRLPATITAVKTDPADTEQVLVTVSCDYTDPQVAGIGYTTAGLILDTYSGIRVSKNALRFSKGDNAVPGVYVKGQRVMKFKKVEILYENDSIMIVKMNTDDSDALRLYDEVIVKGADLYDGKPV